MIKHKINVFLQQAMEEQNFSDALHFFNEAHKLAHPTEHGERSEIREKLRFTLAKLDRVEPIKEDIIKTDDGRILKIFKPSIIQK